MKFRKKPVVIEAVQWTGENHQEVKSLAPEQNVFRGSIRKDTILILTLEGTMTASVGDWIIKGINGEFYPCKPNIFAATYEPVAEES